MRLPRREALRRLGLLGAGVFVGAVAPGTGLSAAARVGGADPSVGSPGHRIDRLDRLDRIGLHLHTVRELLDDDFEGTLQAIAGVGYREVEFAGYHGREADEVRSALVRAGLEAPAAHVSFRTMMSDWEKAIVAAHVIGHRYLVLETIPSNRRQTLSDYRRAAGLFNRAAATARVAGMGFAYHNHAFELESVDGRVPYDVLLGETDPELVHLEMDLHGIRRAGHDPLEYVERFADRIRLLHVRNPGADEEGTRGDRGAMDLRAILARSREAGVLHYVVDHNDSPDPLASARASRERLRALDF